MLRKFGIELSDEVLLEYAEESQFILFCSEEEVLDIMRETILFYKNKCESMFEEEYGK